MKLKDYSGLIVLAIGLGIFITTIIFVFQGGGTKPNTSVQSQADPMSSHHGGSQQGNYADLNGLIGKPLPPFSLADKDGNVFTNESLKGNKVIFFFNEGLMCYPACWSQIISLAQDERFKKNDIKVLSVVVDAKEDWQKAIDKMPELGVATVLYDVGRSLSGALGVTNLPSSMHRGQLPGHTYIMADQYGTVKYALDDPNMAINNDILAQEINNL